MRKQQFEILCIQKYVCISQLEEMTQEQRAEYRKNSNHYVVDADLFGDAEHMGAFIQDVVKEDGNFE